MVSQLRSANDELARAAYGRSKAHKLRQNSVLIAFPDEAWERLAHSLELVQLEQGQVLLGEGAGFEHVYFPAHAVISLQYVLRNGDSCEVARIGHEGCCGLAALMGAGVAPSRAIVQHAGHAVRLRASVLQREFDLGGAVGRVLLKSVQSLFCQVAQTALCNRHHRIEQRLSRWLLVSMDHLRVHDISVTQDWIAGVLGVRRESVTQALLKLRAQRLIANGRNSITVLDRLGLEAASCECYGASAARARRSA